MKIDNYSAKVLSIAQGISAALSLCNIRRLFHKWL